MYSFFLLLLVIDGLVLGVVILLQSGKGGGLAALGGGSAATEGILGGRQATTVLTRATWTAGTAFMVLALILSIMSSRTVQTQSILQPDGVPGALQGPQPVLPGALPDTGTAAPPPVGTPPPDTSGAGGGSPGG